MVRNDLKSFDFERLEEIRLLRRKMKGGGENRQFLNELEKIITFAPSEPENHLYYHNLIPEENTWEKIEWKEIVIGEVWTQPIGVYETRKRMHEYTYMYIASEGRVIREYRPLIIVNKGKQLAKDRSWYIFPDGRIQTTNKSGLRGLVNNFGKPIFVISIESKSSRTY